MYQDHTKKSQHRQVKFYFLHKRWRIIPLHMKTIRARDYRRNVILATHNLFTSFFYSLKNRFNLSIQIKKNVAMDF